MNNELNISFIVTAYNLPASLLEACLKSIFALSLSENEYEVIVVDDGSKEPVINGISDYADRIVYVRQPHSGLSGARNRGLDYARGEYIQFVDGDDCLVQAPYEHCLDFLRFHQPIDMVMFHFTVNTSHKFSTSYKGPMTGVDLMRNNNIHGSACGYIFRKSLVDDLRFTKGIAHEDEEFTPQLLLKAQSVYATSAEAYFYRQRRGSIMHKQTKEHIDKRMDDVFNIIIRLNNIAVQETADHREALTRRVAQLSMDYLYNIIHLTHSGDRLNEAINALQREGLYPLPDKAYTRKYQLFRKLIQHKYGRKMLLISSSLLP
jgi:glycosyltransferase involved in cell wall biosynthesis